MSGLGSHGAWVVTIGSGYAVSVVPERDAIGLTQEAALCMGEYLDAIIWRSEGVGAEQRARSFASKYQALRNVVVFGENEFTDA